MLRTLLVIPALLATFQPPPRPAPASAPPPDTDIFLASFSARAQPAVSRAIACGALGLESLYLVTLFSRRLRPYVGIGGMFFFVGIRALMGPTFEPYLVCGLLLIPWHRVEAAVLRVLYNARTYAPHAACDPAGAGHVPTAAASGSSVRSAAGH